MSLCYLQAFVLLISLYPLKLKYCRPSRCVNNLVLSFNKTGATDYHSLCRPYEEELGCNTDVMSHSIPTVRLFKEAAWAATNLF